MKKGIFEACHWPDNYCVIRIEDPNGEQVDPKDDPYLEGGDYIIFKKIEFPARQAKYKIKQILEENWTKL